MSIDALIATAAVIVLMLWAYRIGYRDGQEGRYR